MTDPVTINDTLTARFAEQWDTGIWYARVTDGDFALIMRKDDYDALAADTVALVTYFETKRAEHAAGHPTGTTRAERIGQFRDALDDAAGEP